MKNSVKISAIILLCLFLTAFFTACGGETAYSFPLLISESEVDAAPYRKLESAGTPTANFVTGKDEDNALFTQLYELLDITAVQKRRPSFSSDVYLIVKESYEEALRVLNRYIKNDFTDLEKVLAIHDYLVSCIAYDYGLYENYVSDPEYEISDDERMSFELSGVFLQKKAVCDGLSKAFMLMCAIEGIEAVYVVGTYRNGTYSMQHAWNKVRLDGEWYNVDITLDSFTASINGKSRVNVLNHGFFLRSDAAIRSKAGGHEESLKGQIFTVPEARGEYDYYAKDGHPVLKDVPLSVSDTDGLISAFKAAKSHKNPKVGAIELKLNFYPYEMSMDVSVYLSAIEKAYGSVSGLSFSYTANQKNPPFSFYPGGIFVFLLRQ